MPAYYFSWAGASRLVWDSETWRGESAGCTLRQVDRPPQRLSQSWLPVGNDRRRTHRPSADHKARVAVGDGGLVPIHDVQAYQLAGCQDGRGVLGTLCALGRLVWLALRLLLREAPGGLVFRRRRPGRLPIRWMEAVERSVGTRGKGAFPPPPRQRVGGRGRPEAWQC